MAKTVDMVQTETGAELRGTITDEEYAELLASGWVDKE